jgi:hypothetical protein
MFIFLDTETTGTGPEARHRVQALPKIERGDSVQISVLHQLPAIQSFLPLLAISNSWILNLIWLIISSMKNTTKRLSGLFDFSTNGKSCRNSSIWVNIPR